MNRNQTEELRGGGGCCKNKNKNKNNTSSISSFEEFATAMKSYVEEPEYFDINDGDEDADDQDCWNVTQDDSYTMLTGKYETANPDCLQDEDDEDYDFLDQYLLSMSPIIEKKTKDRSEKGNKGSSRTVPRRPHDVSVKCSDSTEEITGTPSEVALRLNEAIQHYLPRRKSKIEEEVNKEAAAVSGGEEEFDKDNDKNLQAGNLCPKDEPEYFQETPGCPGTYDRIKRNNVSCSDALVLREIALGRRIKRPDSLGKYESLDYTLPIDKPKAKAKDKDDCCCAKNRKLEGKKIPSSPSPSPQKSCCSRQPRANKNVSFSF